MYCQGTTSRFNVVRSSICIVASLALYFARASFGSPSKLSCPCLPMLALGAPVLTPSFSPSTRALLWAVAGSRSASLPFPVDMSLEIPPEPTLTLVASAEFQSEATGGSSGRGRLA